MSDDQAFLADLREIADNIADTGILGPKPSDENWKSILRLMIIARDEFELSLGVRSPRQLNSGGSESLTPDEH